MTMHTAPGGTIDPASFERDTLARIGAPREVAMRHRLPARAVTFFFATAPRAICSAMLLAAF
jgi:hypothetical protein